MENEIETPEIATALTIMEIDIALADTYSALMEAEIEFEDERERELIYLLFRQAFLRGQRVALDRVRPLIDTFILELYAGRANLLL